MTGQENLLVVELKGRKVVFPEGAAFCLACGAKPAGTRHVFFAGMLDFDAPDPMQAEAKNAKVDFDAPLCVAHLKKATLYTFGAIGLMLLTLGVISSGVILGLKNWLTVILGLLVGIPACVLWWMKDKGGLECSAGSGREVGFGLWYPGGAPEPPSRGR